MDKKKNNGMSRRDFIRKSFLGLAGTAYSLSGLEAFAGNKSPFPQSVTDVLSDGITTRINPRNGDKVGLLGYGMMRLPRNENKEIDQEMVNKEVDYALAHGVNYFDTAPAYGASEIHTGIALKRHPRDSYYIATKMSDNHGNPTFESSVEMYHNSLKRLQTDYIDYYLLHCIGLPSSERFQNRFINNGVLDYLLKEREAGRIRQLGFSFHGDFSTFQWCVDNNDKYKFDFVQIQMNYMDWHHAGRSNTNAETLYALAEKCGWNVIIMEPLQGGRLVKLPKHIEARLHHRFGEEATPASIAFRWVGTYPKVLTALSGMTLQWQLEENVRTFSPLKVMTDDDLKFMEETALLMLDDRTVPCNDCSYCMPCPFGVDIPGNFRYYNSALVAGKVITDTSNPNYEQARKDYVEGLKAIPEKALSSACMKCKLCVPKCPQQIDIPEKLQLLTSLLPKK